MKARVRMFFTKKRYFQKYQTKKRLLVIFLLIVNAHIIAGLVGEIQGTYRVDVSVREDFIGDAEQQARVNEPTNPIGSLVEAGELENGHAGPTQKGGEETPLSIEDKIRKTFPEEPEIMLAIAKAESKLNPHAFNGSNRNGSVDTGIFQINSIHGYDVEYLKNEDNNLKVARKIYEKQGKNAWVAYKNGAFKKWL